MLVNVVRFCLNVAQQPETSVSGFYVGASPEIAVIRSSEYSFDTAFTLRCLNTALTMLDFVLISLDTAFFVRSSLNSAFTQP